MLLKCSNDDQQECIPLLSETFSVKHYAVEHQAIQTEVIYSVPMVDIHGTIHSVLNKGLHRERSGLMFSLHPVPDPING